MGPRASAVAFDPVPGGALPKVLAWAKDNPDLSL